MKASFAMIAVLTLALSHTACASAAGSPFSSIEPNRKGKVTKWDVPFTTWIEVKFGQGARSSWHAAIVNQVEDKIWDDQNYISPILANRVFGVGTNHTFEKPISIQCARLRYERSANEAVAAAYILSASHDRVSFKGAAGLIAYMFGRFMHPLDFGLLGVIAGALLRLNRNGRKPEVETRSDSDSKAGPLVSSSHLDQPDESIGP